MLTIHWPSEPCQVPLWAVPQEVINLSSRASLSEGAGAPHLPWETLGLKAWLRQGRDASWYYFWAATLGPQEAPLGLGFESPIPTQDPAVHPLQVSL